MSPRYAIYYAPEPTSEFWRLGCATLGYDAATGEDVPLRLPPGASEAEWRQWTEAPRRYGFHATLKAPFELRAGLGPPDILAAGAAFAAEAAPVALGRLAVRLIGGFVALAPDAETPGLAALEAACVEFFEPFRAGLSEADQARRLAAQLSPRQAEYLNRFGYPYVLEEFRFHMTLTGSLAPATREPVRSALAARFGEVSAGAVLDAVAVFRQNTRSDRFRMVQRWPLRGGRGGTAPA